MLRFEWFREWIHEKSLNNFDSVSYYDITAGTNITLNEHFVIRPELRYDYAFEESRKEGFTFGTVFGVVF